MIGEGSHTGGELWIPGTDVVSGGSAASLILPSSYEGPKPDHQRSKRTPEQVQQEAADAIPVLRGQIDALDEGIIRLVAERAKLSRRIQQARMNGGGVRVELGRERIIMDAYRAALGPQGPTLADAVLQVCRGAR